MAAPTVDVTSKAEALILSSTSSGSMNVAIGSGSNRVLVVFLIQRGSILRTFSSVTFNSVALTQVPTAAEETSLAVKLQVTCWLLVNPPTGTSALSVAMSGNTSLQAFAFGLDDADQAAPLDQHAANSSAASTTPNASVTPSVNDEIVIGGMVHEGQSASAPDAGLDDIFEKDQGAWNTGVADKRQTTATPQTIGWTNGESLNWAALAVSFKSAAGAADVVVTPTPAAAVMSTTAPSAVQASLTIAPNAATLRGQTTAPAVVLETVAVVPDPATARMQGADPLVVLGNVTVTPAPAACVVSVADPTIIQTSAAVIPVPADAVFYVVNPVVHDGGDTARRIYNTRLQSRRWWRHL